MKTSVSLAILFCSTLAVTPTFAQAPASSPPAATSPAAGHQVPAGAPGQMSKADMDKMMAQMMELGKPSDNHKLLADMVGTWNYTIKMWMDPTPGAKPEESTGTSVTKSIMDGRYFITDVTGKMEMPGPDGKKKPMDFKGMGIGAYDNIKKKFVGTWIDSMSTMVMMSEGTYDPATKAFTYNAECEMMPGMHTKIRQVVKIVDKDHHTMEWYEDRGGREVKTMEINYTRKK